MSSQVCRTRYQILDQPVSSANTPLATDVDGLRILDDYEDITHLTSFRGGTFIARPVYEVKETFINRAGISSYWLLFASLLNKAGSVQ